MTKTVVIYKKEMKSFFASPVAYIVIAMFLVISAYFFNIILFSTQEANFTLRFMSGNISIILLFMIPGLTMRLLTEEKKVGTIELLMTSPLKNADLVLGKFFSCLCLFAIMLGLTLVYIVILFLLGKPDFGPLCTIYFGLLLLGSSFISIGVFGSSLTDNQIIAFVISLAMLLVFWLIGWLGSVTGPIGEKIFQQISILSHFESFSKGIIDLTDIFYYLAISFIFLFLSIRIIESRQWKE